MRRRDVRPDRLCGDTVKRILVERDGFYAKDTPETGFFEGLLKPFLCFMERNIVQVNGHWENYTTAEVFDTLDNLTVSYPMELA